MSLSLEDYEALNPRTRIHTDVGDLVFSTPTTFTRWRAESLFTKEPCTLEWLGDLRTDQVLLDVGANVGVYTVWASAIRRATVIALEPEAENYALLNRNIRLNNVADRVTALPLALSNVDEASHLYIRDTRIGGSNHSAGESLDFALRPVESTFRQGCFLYRLDTLIHRGVLQVPDHIKIDVDGFEHRVIEGAANTLRDPKVRSLLIETNPSLTEHQAMIVALENLGFTYDPDQVLRARRSSGPFEGVAEYVFKR